MERRKPVVGDKIERHTSRHVTETHRSITSLGLYTHTCTRTHTAADTHPCTATDMQARSRSQSNQQITVPPPRNVWVTSQASFPTSPQSPAPFLSLLILLPWTRTAPFSLPSPCSPPTHSSRPGCFALPGAILSAPPSVSILPLSNAIYPSPST